MLLVCAGCCGAASTSWRAGLNAGATTATITGTALSAVACTGQQDAVGRVWAPVVCWLWRCCMALSQLGTARIGAAVAVWEVDDWGCEKDRHVYSSGPARFAVTAWRYLVVCLYCCGISSSSSSSRVMSLGMRCLPCRFQNEAHIPPALALCARICITAAPRLSLRMLRAGAWDTPPPFWLHQFPLGAHLELLFNTPCPRFCLYVPDTPAVSSGPGHATAVEHACPPGM